MAKQTVLIGVTVTSVAAVSFTTAAGAGNSGYSGDGGPAKEAQLDSPQEFETDAEGHVDVIDEHNKAIRLNSADGQRRTLLGNEKRGYWRLLRTKKVFLTNPEAMVIKRDGSLLLAENHNRKTRVVPPSDRVSVFAGEAEMKLADKRTTEKNP